MIKNTVMFAFQYDTKDQTKLTLLEMQLREYSDKKDIKYLGKEYVKHVVEDPITEKSIESRYLKVADDKKSLEENFGVFIERVKSVAEELGLHLESWKY